MSNAAEHAIGAAIAVGVTHAFVETRDGRPMTLAPLVSAYVATAFGSGPDFIEPAIHPNHRQFFHSVVFGIAVAYGIKKAWEWNPDDPWLRLIRGLGLIAGGAYLVHLVMDARTAKSIPWLGSLR